MNVKNANCEVGDAVLAQTGECCTKAEIIEFARSASTEISSHDVTVLAHLSDSLARGTTIYVAHTPKATLEDVIQASIQVQALGFRATPHIVARRLVSERELRRALTRVRDAGIDQILLIAGDRKDAAGPFSSSMDVMNTGATVDAQITSIGVAGHPEKHPVVGAERLFDALTDKQTFAARTGSKVHIVTQFGFDPNAVCAWAMQLRRSGITLPIHVGIAGPTSLRKLMSFAVKCGVGASLSSPVKNLQLIGRLARPVTDPAAMLSGLLKARMAGASSITQPHLFAFGGTESTVAWLNSVVHGRFDLRANSDHFQLHD